jgi:flagellar hook assembly protein FlgD
VILKVYDLLGRLVKTIVDEEEVDGSHRAVWNDEDDIGRKVSSGVYFIRLQIETEIKTQKIVIIK